MSFAPERRPAARSLRHHPGSWCNIRASLNIAPGGGCIGGTRGFTLVEVLVALAIAAIALSAIARAVIHATDITTVLRERQTALWVAQNQLTKTRLAGIWPAADTTKGTVTLAGREWQWKQRVITTAEDKLRRIEVDVTLSGDDTNSVHLFGFVRHPARVQ